jgi:hypothetical protein
LRVETPRQVELLHPPLSCRDWLDGPLCAWPASSVVPGILAMDKRTDLQHLLLAAAERRSPGDVCIVEPWDALMQPMRGLPRLRAAMDRCGLPMHLVAASKVARM